MSRTVNAPSTTKTILSPAQESTYTLPDINFSLAGKISLTLDIDPEILTLLKTIFSRLPGKDKETSEIVTDALEKTTIEPDQDEPSELSVNIPDDLIEAPRRYNVTHRPTWNTCLNVRWREEGQDLIIKYKNEDVRTKWGTMKQLASIREEDARIQVIRDILGDEFTNNKRTAYNQFATHLRNGKIKQPLYDPFSVPIDPDAPALAGLNLTRVDTNCGNGEECN